jgi:hypothetical protein
MAGAQGGSPVSFVDANGTQYALPLPYVAFGSGGPEAAGWPGWNAVPPGLRSAQQAGITTWLGLLATQGLMAPAAEPPNPPAFLLRARDPGSAGNGIVLTVNAVYPDGTADVTVTVSQSTPGLTPASIATVLGTPAAPGTAPGLAVVGTGLASLPQVTAATRFSAATPPGFPVPGSGGGILLPTHDTPAEAADAGLITASITAVAAGTGPGEGNGAGEGNGPGEGDGAGGTFTLTLTWTKPVTGITVAALAARFGYVLAVGQPQSGFGAWPAPNTTVSLLGGTDAAAGPATQATATAISA